MTGPVLRVSEIFRSLQGESAWAGWPTTFVRLVGCPVRCVYCDTPYAFSGGERLTLTAILERVAELGTPRVCVTGGEPLAQPHVRELLAALIEAGYHVSLETSGVRPLRDLPRPCKVVLDLKTPGSGVAGAWLAENLAELRAGDELKVVVTGREDWRWFLAWYARHAAELPRGVEVAVAPAKGEVEERELAEWLLASGLGEVRLNVQLHKWLWPERERGV